MEDALVHAIDAQLQRLKEMFEEDGCWTGEDYMTMVKPLHEALLKLAEQQLINCTKKDN